MFDKDAINTLTKAEAITAADKAMTSQVQTLIALPEDFKIHDLEGYLQNRRRVRGTMGTSTVAAFAAYAATHAQEGATVFVDVDQMAATAVLNLGTPDDPGHADNKAVLQPKKTAAYRSLLVHATGQGLKQQQAAEFLEDWPEHIECFNDGGKIAPPQAIAAIRKLTIESMRKLESSEQSLSASKSAFESVQATSADPIPTTIYFKCAPYQDLSERLFVLRLGVQTGAAAPAIVLRIVKQETHAEEMASELAALVTVAIGESMPVLLGQYARGQ